MQGRVIQIWLQGVGDHHLFLYDQQGQLLTSWIVSGSDSIIDFNLPDELFAGMYILSLVDGKNVISEKIFIE